MERERDPVTGGYPSFAPLFERELRDSSTGVHCVDFLNPQYCPADRVLTTARALRQATLHSPDVEAEVMAMLHVDLWRPHLVAAAAIAFGVDSPRVIAKLWETFDREAEGRGVFVAPQLAAAAYLHDPMFEERARIRIRDDYRKRSRKSLASLVRLCRLLSTSQAWLDMALEDADRREATVDKWDHGGEIAASWLESIQWIQTQLR